MLLYVPTVLLVAFAVGLALAQAPLPSESASGAELEFDESDIRNLNLRLKWRFAAESGAQRRRTPTRFILLMQQKRLNASSFVYDVPQLIDDESIIETSAMTPDRFKARVVVVKQSNSDCALHCINSTRFSVNNRFDCNIFYYEPQSRMCVLYEYDFSAGVKNQSDAETMNAFGNRTLENQTTTTTSIPSRNESRTRVPVTPTGSKNDELYEYFMDECEIDEILGDVIGYSRYCRRILDYRDSHVIRINPFVEYRFSISVRDDELAWTPFIKREYQYAPKIEVIVDGDVKIGNNVTLECRTEINSSLIDSITWKNNNPLSRQTLRLFPLTVHNIYQTYFCEIRYNFVRLIQKAFKLNFTSYEDLKPRLRMNVTADVESLHVRLNWTVQSAIGAQFRPEKMILLYSENGQPYKFVNKYLLFELSNYDNIRFNSLVVYEEMLTSNEDECAMACLQKNYCEHFVFVRSVEFYKGSKKKNCRLAANTNDNIIPCRFDSLCATLSPFESHVFNSTLNILVLPNITYRFKVQLKDKLLNWTDMEETAPINMPLKMSIEQVGNTMLSDESNDFKFQLTCLTNINKNVAYQISWMRDDKDLVIDGKLFSKRTLNETQYANSVLEFKALEARSFDYSGAYKCKIYIRYPDVGQGTAYVSEARRLAFSDYVPLRYNVSSGNVTLPAVPGLIFELSCRVSGNPMPALKWLIDGVNYSERKFETLTDEPFVINITNKNASAVLNHILIMKIDGRRAPARYQCVLNDTLVVRDHFIEIVDARPLLAVRVDNASLQRLRVAFKFDVRPSVVNGGGGELLAGVDWRPTKLFALYVENSTFDWAYQNVIAPDTLSRSDTRGAANGAGGGGSDRLPLATLKNTVHGIQSCKISCFLTPFCKSYEYLMYDDSCNFFSSSAVDGYYRTLMSILKNRRADEPGQPSFDLLHLLQGNILSVLQETSASLTNNTVVIDKKSYPECEPKPTAFAFTEEMHCSDELSDYADSYAFEGLLPGTSYQFKFQVAGPLGVSEPVLTSVIDVPFPLDEITEVNETRNERQFYSLVCSTPLVKTDHLSFRWYLNERLIATNDSAYEQVLHQPLDRHESSPTTTAFSAELVFRDAARKASHGFYTCSLTYADDSYTIAKNRSFYYRPKTGPFFEQALNVVANRSLGEQWNESCWAEGWPVPTLEWRFNDRPVNLTYDYNNYYADDDDSTGAAAAASRASASASSTPLVHNHVRHLKAYSSIVLRELRPQSSGRYSCVLNGKQVIRKINLIVLSPASDDMERKSSDSNEDAEKINDRRASKNGGGGVSAAIVCVLLVLVVVTASSVIAFFYFKKRKYSSSTSLAYNRIEEEMLTGVDNLVLTDDANHCDRVDA